MTITLIITKITVPAGSATPTSLPAYASPRVVEEVGVVAREAREPLAPAA